MVRNSFIVNVSSVSDDEMQKDVNKMYQDSNLKDKFESGINLENF